jgi:hypothetical protein
MGGRGSECEKYFVIGFLFGLAMGLLILLVG